MIHETPGQIIIIFRTHVLQIIIIIYLLPPKTCGCQPCWMTGSYQHGLYLTTAPTDKSSFLSESKQEWLSVTDCPSMSTWVLVHARPPSPTQAHVREVKQYFLCFLHRTQQITSVQSASHSSLRSTTQRPAQCWMKAGQLLSRNLYVVKILAIKSVVQLNKI